jgi:thiosulfate/3-mercaptopyruvate sulfurtransferase
MRNRSRASVVAALVIGAILIAPGLTSAQPAASKDLLVTTTWLAEHLRDPKVVLVWTGGSAPAQLIPGSRAVPHEQVMTTIGGHDLPPVDDLVAMLRRIGISNDSHVVVYGEPMAAGWLFFALDYLGHDHVSWLDGGLERWTAERRATAAPVSASVEGTVTARLRAALKSTAADVQSRPASGGAVVLDARSAPEYASGHIPGARSLEWEKVFTDGSLSTFKKPDELIALFTQAGLQAGRPAITYCAVGLRASVLYFAAKFAGFEASTYVGSWRDWQEKKLPIER